MKIEQYSIPCCTQRLLNWPNTLHLDSMIAAIHTHPCSPCSHRRSILFIPSHFAVISLLLSSVASASVLSLWAHQHPQHSCCSVYHTSFSLGCKSLSLTDWPPLPSSRPLFCFFPLLLVNDWLQWSHWFRPCYLRQNASLWLCIIRCLQIDTGKGRQSSCLTEQEHLL